MRRTVRDREFAGVPVVHIAVARDRLQEIRLQPDMIGNAENHDPTPTLQLALRLHPGTRRLIVIRGASDLDRRWDGRIGAATAELGDAGVAIVHLSALPTATVLARVAALTRGDLVFTPRYFLDGVGEVTTPRQSIERIANASTVPAYGAFDTQVGTGIVGGYVTRFDDQARAAGAIVVRLLSGDSPTQVATSAVQRVPMVDWRQLRRWHVDERVLPADTIVTFREPTAWDRYWREISLGAAIVIFQAALIAALLLFRSGRRAACDPMERWESSLCRDQRQHRDGDPGRSVRKGARRARARRRFCADDMWLFLPLQQQFGPFLSSLARQSVPAGAAA